MYSLSLLTVDLKIAKERLLNLFEIADSIDSQPKNSRRPTWRRAEEFESQTDRPDFDL